MTSTVRCSSTRNASSQRLNAVAAEVAARTSIIVPRIAGVASASP